MLFRRRYKYDPLHHSKTYRFWVFHLDKDYGLEGFFYIEDHIVFSHGYAPGLTTAVLCWLRNIPRALGIRKMMKSIDQKSREMESRQQNAS